jgi:hypothetical protein
MNDEQALDELQAELDRSWELAREANDRPAFRARLEASVYQVRELPPAIREQMLAARRDVAFRDWVEDQATRLRAASA